MSNIILEACVETFEQCVNAEKQGAGRLELCDRLDLGGTTPSEELIKRVKAAVNIPIRVMIRPRGGNFTYTPEELDEMRQSILMCRRIGVDGIVLGILTHDNHLDIDTMKPLIELAKPLNVVIHKAIDDTENPLAEMDRLQQIDGVDAILTSGKMATALEGAPLLRKMVANQKHIRIIAAGKVTNQNIDDVKEAIGASQYHGKKIVGDI
jgi:copper homeostasis protein